MGERMGEFDVGKTYDRRDAGVEQLEAAGGDAAGAMEELATQLKGLDYADGISALSPSTSDLPIMREGAGGVVGDPGAAFSSATSGAGGAVPYQAEMEGAFGQDFSGVQAYTGQVQAMDNLGANAAAQGESVAFRASSPSKETVAHELTHVVQHRQSGGGPVAASGPVSSHSDGAEVEARSVARDVVAGKKVQVKAAAAAPIQRDDAPGRVQHSWSHESCYLASILQLIAAVPKYVELFDADQTALDDGTEGKRLQVQLKPLVATVKGGGTVSREDVETTIAMLEGMGILSRAEAQAQGKKATSKKASSSDDSPARLQQQDVADVFGNMLGKVIQHHAQRRAFSTKTREDRVYDEQDQQDITEREHEHFLTLHAGAGETLEDLLRHYFGQERRADAAHPHTLSKKATRLPDVLTINVARNDYTPVDMPKSFLMPAEVNYDGEAGPRYKLQAFLSHNAPGSRGGHYTAFVRGQEEEDSWYHSDDLAAAPREVDPARATNGDTQTPAVFCSVLYTYVKVPDADEEAREAFEAVVHAHAHDHGGGKSSDKGSDKGSDTPTLGLGHIVAKDSALKKGGKGGIFTQPGAEHSFGEKLKHGGRTGAFLAHAPGLQDELGGLEHGIFSDLPDEVDAEDLDFGGKLFPGKKTSLALDAFREGAHEHMGARQKKAQTRETLGVTKLKHAKEDGVSQAYRKILDPITGTRGMTIEIDDIRRMIRETQEEIEDLEGDQEWLSGQLKLELEKLTKKKKSKKKPSSSETERLEKRLASLTEDVQHKKQQIADWEDRIEAARIKQEKRKKEASEYIAALTSIREVREQVILTEARLKQLEKILDKTAKEDLKALKAKRKEIAPEVEEAREAFEAAELALAQERFDNRGEVVEEDADPTDAEVDYHLTGSDYAFAKSKESELDRAEGAVVGAQKLKGKARKVMTHLQIQECHMANLKGLVKYLRGGETGSMDIGLKVGVSAGMSSPDGSTKASAGVFIKVGLNVNVQDDRKFRATGSIGIGSELGGSFAGEMVKAGISSGLTGSFTRVFLDDNQWAAWLAFKLAKLHAHMRHAMTRTSHFKGSGKSKIDKDDMAMLEEAFGPDGAAYAKQILKYNRGDIPENAITSVTALKAELGANSNLFLIGADLSKSEQAMRFTKEDGSSHTGYVGSYSSTIKVGALSLTATRNSIVGHANPDNDGEYINLALTLPPPTAEVAIEDPDAGNSAEVLQDAGDLLKEIGLPENDDAVPDWYSNLSKVISGKIASFPALKKCMDVFDKIGISVSKKYGYEVNYVQNDDTGIYHEQYRRQIGGAGLSVSGSAPVMPGLNVDAGIEMSAGRTQNEQLGTTTTTYIETVYNGLAPRDRRDVKVGVLDNFSNGQWRTWATGHRQSILAIARGLTNTRSNVYKEVGDGALKTLSDKIFSGKKTPADVSNSDFLLWLAEFEQWADEDTAAKKAKLDWSPASKQKLAKPVSEVGMVKLEARVTDGNVDVGAAMRAADNATKRHLWITDAHKATNIGGLLECGMAVELKLIGGGKNTTVRLMRPIDGDNFLKAVTNKWPDPAKLPGSLATATASHLPTTRAAKNSYPDGAKDAIRTWYENVLLAKDTDFNVPPPPGR